MDTSSTEVSSSAMISGGSLTSARAMLTRWRWPPDNCAGRRYMKSGSRPTSVSNWATRSVMSFCGTMPCATSGSARVEPMLRRGLREFSESWNIICTMPLRACTDARLLSSPWPSSRMVPLVARSSPTMVRARVDLPLPDCPTIPTVCPGSTASGTPFNAVFDAFLRKRPLLRKSTTRSRTSSSSVGRDASS